MTTVTYEDIARKRRDHLKAAHGQADADSLIGEGFAFSECPRCDRIDAEYARALGQDLAGYRETRQYEYDAAAEDFNREASGFYDRLAANERV
jgi:hypothetical protein